MTKYKMRKVMHRQPVNIFPPHPIFCKQNNLIFAQMNTTIEKRYYNSHEDYQVGLWQAERAALFKHAFINGRLHPFEISASLELGKICDNDYFKVEEYSKFVFETIVHAEIEYINN